MSRDTPQSIRTAISKKYLDWAEQLPKFRVGPIHSLQVTREFDRREAQEQKEKSKAPSGASIEFPYFRLIEVFNVEEFSKLQDGLFRLFPRLTDPAKNREFLKNFIWRTEAIQGGMWSHVGYVFRDAKNRLAVLDTFAEISSLPEEVDSITVELHNFMPSMIVVTLDVDLTDAATQRLNTLQSASYLPDVRFRNLLPWRAWRGYSTTQSAALQRRAILSFEEDLRQRVERCFARFLRGYFFETNRNSHTRLPAIDCFFLKGAPEKEDDFNKWIDDSRQLLDSYALRLTFDSYRNNELCFVSSRERESEYWGNPPDRLLIRWENSVKVTSTNGFGGDPKRAILHDSQHEIMSSLVPRIVILEFLSSIEKQIERSRNLAFKSMASRRLLGAYLRVYKKILQSSMLLDRTAMEFGKQKWLIQDDLQTLSTLEEVRPGTRDESKLGTVASNTVIAIEGRIDLLNTYLSHVRNSFSEFVSLQNLRMSYRLQWIVIWLSAIATLATVIGVLTGWPVIKQFLKDVLDIQFP